MNRILIVEDDRDIAGNLLLLLKRKGLRLLRWEPGRKALNRYGGNPLTWSCWI